MRNVTPEHFVRLWNEAVENRHPISWSGRRIGCSDQTVHGIATSLRRAGVKLPSIRRTFVETADINKLNRLITEKFGGRTY